MSIRGFMHNLISGPARPTLDTWGLDDHSGSKVATSESATSSNKNASPTLPPAPRRSPVAKRSSKNRLIPNDDLIDAINSYVDRAPPQDTARLRRFKSLDRELAVQLDAFRKSHAQAGGGRLTLQALTHDELHAEVERTDDEIKLHLLLDNQCKAAKNASATRSGLARGKRFDKEGTLCAYKCVEQDDYHTRFVASGTADQSTGNLGTANNVHAKSWPRQSPKQAVGSKLSDATKISGKAKTGEEIARIRKAADSEHWCDWLRKNGLEVVESSKDQNNCLLVSVLQHASGRYSSAALAQHERRARKLRAATPVEHQDIPVGAELTPDCAVTKWAIERINKAYRRKVRLITVQPRQLSESEGSGVMPLIDYGRDAIAEDDEPIVVQSNGSHFQAIRRKPAPIDLLS